MGTAWDDYGANFDKALERGAEMRESPAKLVVEIQFMTKEYYAMRKKTHAWYKVVRSDHASGMVTDYQGGLAATHATVERLLQKVSVADRNWETECDSE